MARPPRTLDRILLTAGISRVSPVDSDYCPATVRMTGRAVAPGRDLTMKKPTGEDAATPPPYPRTSCWPWSPSTPLGDRATPPREVSWVARWSSRRSWTGPGRSPSRVGPSPGPSTTRPLGWGWPSGAMPGRCRVTWLSGERTRAVHDTGCCPGLEGVMLQFPLLAS